LRDAPNSTTNELEATMSDDLDDLTKDELQDRARDADLPTSGTKSELQDRLREQDSEDRSSSGSSNNSARDAISVAQRELSSTIGVEVESVTGAQLDSDTDEWTIEVQTIESRRIPPSGDVISLYTVTINGDEMVGFDRIKRGRRDSLDIS